MRRLLNRLLRLLEQDRIELPRRELEPRDIRTGDRLQIGQETWRVGEARSSAHAIDGRAFALIADRASAPVAILMAELSTDGNRIDGWVLIREGNRLEVPGEMIVRFPSGAWTTPGSERRGT